MLPISLDCPFLIAISVFSNVKSLKSSWTGKSVKLMFPVDNSSFCKPASCYFGRSIIDKLDFRCGGPLRSGVVTL